MTVSTVTAPPVPECLVSTDEPSGCSSAIGKPGRCPPSGNSVKKLKLPPVTCAPHSIRCPATVAPASASRSSRVQPKRAIAGPTASEASVTRPVTTTSAPASRQAAIPNAPR